MDFDDDIPF
nr:Chain B, Single-stranded DNA-binding protein [Escherichia coli]3UF7_C Chain C, Single-stranded DNA-binding protein [Escherichia coli]